MVREAALIRLSALASPAAGWSYEGLRDHARAAEAAGLSVFWVSDHFFGAEGVPDRIASRRGRCSPRSPATRRPSGSPAGVRVTQMRETLEICRRLWTEERATYEGRHYRMVDAVCAPKPVQAPHPPIWIGGTKPRIMRVAARYADGFNIGRLGQPARVPTRDELGAFVRELQAACAEVGRERPLRLSHWAPCELSGADDVRRLVDDARRLADGGVEEFQLSFPKERAVDPRARPRRSPGSCNDRARRYAG